MVGIYPLGALAHLGIARAYALQGDSAKSRVAYQDFLTLWKDADPEERSGTDDQLNLIDAAGDRLQT